MSVRTLLVETSVDEIIRNSRTLQNVRGTVSAGNDGVRARGSGAVVDGACEIEVACARQDAHRLFYEPCLRPG